MDQAIEKAIKRIKPQYYAAFFGALIIGLIAHMPVMVHNYPTLDTFWNLYSDQNMISSGRQFLTIACGPTSFYNLTWVNGVVALFYLALAAVILVELFHIDNSILAVLLGGTLAAFPAVTGTFVFIYTIDGYMMAFALVCACVLLSRRWKWGFIPGIIGIGFALGVYQSYFSVAILLCIFVILQDILRNGEIGNKAKETESAGKGGKTGKAESIKALLLTGLRFAIMGVGGYAFYLITLKIMLFATGATMSGYQGSDRVGSFNLSGLPAGLKAAFEDFRIFTKGGGVFTVNPWMKGAYALFMVLTAGLFVYLFIRNKCYKQIGNILLSLVLISMIPFAASLVLVMAPEAFFHILMRMPWAVFFVFGATLLQELKGESGLPQTEAGDEIDKNEKSLGIKNKLRMAVSFVGMVALAVLVFNFILSANVVYFNLNERYEKTYALSVRIADRLEQTEGYHMGDPVAILGGYPGAENYPSTDITNRVTKAFHAADGDYCVNSTEKYAEFMRHYLNVTIVPASSEEQIRLSGEEEFLQMPKFPEKESIQKLDGVWVVKLNG